MGIRLRLTLLILAAIAAVAGPSNRPPGARSELPPVRTLPCPLDNCGGHAQWKSGYKYYCDECGGSFYFCTTCSRQLTGKKAAKHKHAMS
jgi:hypothetical protein